MKLLVFLMLITSYTFATDNFDSMDCSLFGVEHGCITRPRKDVKKDRLILYIRGLYKGMKKVPEDEYMDSIFDLQKTYKLDTWAKENNYAFYGTTEHTVSFTADQINKIAKRLELDKDYELIIVSHSGGHRGLYETLKNLNQKPADMGLKQIIMMDNFYADSELIPIYAEAIEKGAKCSGFLTTHNIKRYNERYKNKLVCDVEGPAGFDHYTSVAKCLTGYITQQKCK